MYRNLPQILTRGSSKRKHQGSRPRGGLERGVKLTHWNMFCWLVYCSVLSTLAVAARSAVAEDNATGPGARFKQTDFCISFWVDPPADEHMEEYYRQIAEANFTVVLGGFGARAPQQISRQLQVCEKYGLKAIVAGEGPADKLPDGPACLGYKVRDEPSAGDFAGLGQRVREIRAARPGKLAYINLFPSFASPAQLGTPTYEQHVSKFLEQTPVDVLSFDRYPIMTPTVDDRPGYLENLAVIRQHALKAGIPFWNFFNIMPFGPHFDPTEAQVAWQIYTSLAYGAKGVLYFCYWTPRGGEFPKGGAIITADGRPTRHYDQARRINARIKNLGPTLMKLTSTKVIRIKPGEKAAAALAGSPLENLSDGDWLIGVFKHADGRRAVLLNNYRFAYTAWPTVEFAGSPDKVVEVDQTTGEETKLRDDSPDMPGIQISLDAGQGRLFIMDEK